ncbi:MAG: HDOD domain-containing protein [Candidatus Riflebacteria bacterium]|nr:HDOD domain-containing protein [Candidatus Riflebacteria bacterium]
MPPMQTMETILKRLRDLPILNSEAFRLIEYCSSPKPAFEVLEGMVKNNPNLAGQIVRLANSAFYKRSKPTETLMDALVLLGLTTLKQVFVQSFYASVGKMLNTQSRVLEHGRECALLAEFIGRGAGLDAAECGRHRLGGLLHDIGKQFLAFFFPQPYEQVTRMMKLERTPSFQAEKKIFGVTHQEVGATLCARWNFPSFLVDIIKAHHAEGPGGPPPGALPVFCANGFLHQRDGEAFQPWEAPLRAWFAARRVTLPWKNLVDEFRAFLRTHTGSPLA